MIGLLVAALALAVAAPALAADCEWQLYWDYGGAMTETISGGELDEAVMTAAGFQTQNGEEFTRTATGWNEYIGLDSRLPIAVGGRDLKFLRTTVITGAPAQPANALAASLSEQRVELSLFVPGSVRATSGEQTETEDGFKLFWQFSGGSTISASGQLARVWVFDGFLCAVLLVVLGVFGLVIYFGLRMRKVDKFIKEEYSIDNINIKELEVEVERELDQLEKER